MAAGNNGYISKIIDKDGLEYQLKDATAQQSITEMQEVIGELGSPVVDTEAEALRFPSSLTAEVVEGS